MNIVVISRTKNEAHNVKSFCTQYGFANKILIADNGSTDNTVALLAEYPLVSVTSYLETIVRPNGFVDVPEASHVNYLVEWAKKFDPDFIILDDFDCYPNYLLKRDARELLEKANSLGYNQVNINRLYIYKQEAYFPDMNKAGTSLWGWNPKSRNVWMTGDTTHMTVNGIDNHHYPIDLPYCLLHNSWPTDEIINRKMALWHARGEERGEPMTFGGSLMPLPEWAREGE